MKRYQVTCLTPTLAGDGQRLAPIDYMVWRDQVNVLDQRRIFKLLSRGPRLDSYLTQIRKAEKLDFASWGGFAQNFAGRRIPFDDASSSAVWERARPDQLFIPTFACREGGIFIPGSVLKGALRWGLIADRAGESNFKDLDGRMKSDRPPRHPGEALEASILGAPGLSRTRTLLMADSSAVPHGATRVYLLRTATVVQKGAKRELGWQLSTRGAADGRRPEDSAPLFAEMCAPGTVFEGEWNDRVGLRNPEVLRALRWKEASGAKRFAQSANKAAERLLATQAAWAESVGLAGVAASIAGLQQTLAGMNSSGSSCLLCLGWGTGLLAKSADPDMTSETLRELLKDGSPYAAALRSGLPFPKTRKVVFGANQPAALPGWMRLDFLE
jgi:CRISPR-associated protein Csm5